MRLHRIDENASGEVAPLLAYLCRTMNRLNLVGQTGAQLPAYGRHVGLVTGTGRFTLSPIAYNTNLVKKEDAPKSFADLLDPKWAGKMVKGHPAYSGTIMTATFAA